jgi:hypothetical protein
MNLAGITLHDDDDEVCAQHQATNFSVAPPVTVLPIRDHVQSGSIPEPPQVLPALDVGC